MGILLNLIGFSTSDNIWLSSGAT